MTHLDLPDAVSTDLARARRVDAWLSPLTLLVLSQKGYLSPNPHTLRSGHQWRREARVPDGTSCGLFFLFLAFGTGGPRADKDEEDPQTEPQQFAHAAPGNPSRITLEDMSNQEDMGSASKPEATLTHPSARDTWQGRPALELADSSTVLAGRAGGSIFLVEV